MYITSIAHIRFYIRRYSPIIDSDFIICHVILYTQVLIVMTILDNSYDRTSPNEYTCICMMYMNITEFKKKERTFMHFLYDIITVVRYASDLCKFFSNKRTQKKD